MARIERIKQRLENWALWKVRQASNGLGFHTMCILAVDVWNRTSYNGVSIPHLDQEAEETDRALQDLKKSKPHLLLTVQRIYILDLGVQEAARQALLSPSTIHAHLSQVDVWISKWLEDQRILRDKRIAAKRGKDLMQEI